MVERFCHGGKTKLDLVGWHGGIYAGIRLRDDSHSIVGKRRERFKTITWAKV